MARTNLPIVPIALAGTTVEGAGTAVDPANGHVIDCTGVKAQRLVVRINSTFAGAKTFTFKAAALNPPGFRGGIGDLVVTLNAQVGYVVLETARHQGQAAPDQAKIYCDVAAAATGAIWVYQMPEGI